MTTPQSLSLLVQRAVTLLEYHAPKDGSPYIGAFSGGKDSVAIKELARMAGVPVEWHYHNTTIDPPELLTFIRRHHPDVIWDSPKHGYMLHRMLYKGFPTRTNRWCCEEYKENNSFGNRLTILGVRVAESANRKSRWTNCVMDNGEWEGRSLILPIRLWSEDDVWSFIGHRSLSYCSLYDEGFDRLGCIGCPLAGAEHRKRLFARFPKHLQNWRLYFRRLWEAKAGTIGKHGSEWWGSRYHDSWEELFDWWNDGQKNVTKWRRKKGLRIKTDRQEAK